MQPPWAESGTPTTKHEQCQLTLSPEPRTPGYDAPNVLRSARNFHAPSQNRRQQCANADRRLPLTEARSGVSSAIAGGARLSFAP